VQTATVTVQGRAQSILVDANGLPLYTYRPDTSTMSFVTGQLAVLWPPVLGTGVLDRSATGTLTSVATPNGKQVAYNGHFLYTFTEDSPGRVTGQGVQNFFVATPSLAAAAPNAGSVAPPQYGSGY
jgi:predicted lipoprotein with Yx(FWY)xxD motif